MRDRHDRMESGIESKDRGRERSGHGVESDSDAIRAPGRRTLVAGTPSGAAVDRGVPAGKGSVQLPEGMGLGAPSAYTESRGEYLGFGAEIGPGGLAAAGAGPTRLPEGLGAASASPYAQATREDLGFGADYGAGDMVAAANHSPSAALPDAARARFEACLGGSLASVRVHGGPASAKAAASLGARAFATGQDIHFGAGEYSPGTHAGDRLLAHEVAHTRQQAGAGASVQAKLEVGAPDDPAEREADAAADAMLAGAPAQVSAAGGIARQALASPVAAASVPGVPTAPAAPNATNPVRFDPARFDFPVLKLGGAPAKKTGMLRYEGEQPLPIASKRADGTSFEVTRGAGGDVLFRGNPEAAYEVTFHPSQEGLNASALRVHTTTSQPATLSLEGYGFAHPTIHTPQRATAPEEATADLAKLELIAPPANLLGAFKQRQTERGGSGVGEAPAKDAYREQLAALKTMIGWHKRAHEWGGHLEPASPGDLTRGQRLLRDPSREASKVQDDQVSLQRVDHDFELASVQILELRGAMEAGLHEGLALMHDAEHVRLERAVTKSRKELDDLRKERAGWASWIKTGADALGKVMKFAGKITDPKKWLEATGELVEGAGSVLSRLAGDHVNAGRIKAKEGDLRALVKAARHAEDSVLYERILAWAAAYRNIVERIEPHFRMMKTLSDTRRAALRVLGRSAGAALGGDARTTNLISRLPFAEAVVGASIAEGPLEQLHEVDNPDVIRQLQRHGLGGTLEDYAFSSWLAEHGPRIGDAARALYRYYLREAVGTKSLIAAMSDTQP